MRRKEARKLPRLFRIGRYVIFFWSNEDHEPIHVHIAVKPTANATKIWLTKNGGCVLAHSKGRIPRNEINELFDIISIRFFYICSEWKKYFRDDIRFYC